MPLEHAQVDAVRKAEDGRIVLVIMDEGNVTDSRERVACLVQKLKIYINSIVSGDTKMEFPECTARDFVIEVACRRRPTPEMLNISEVMPRKDPANKVPVRFIEFPQGSWGPAKMDDLEGVEFARAAAPRQGERPLDSLSLAVLVRGVELAENFLAEGEKGFYFAVLGWDECKTDAIYFRETGVTEEIVREVDQYVRELTPAFTVCALVSVEQVKEFRRGNREALVLVLHRRGWKQGRVYARPVRQSNALQKYEAADTLQMIGTRPGVW